MTIRILTGDCREVLPTLAAGSVHCCVTSPPYFGLRSYLPDGHPDKAKEIGLEQTPDDYVAAMVAVFREVRRVLRDDGTLWLNVGDSYARDAKKGQHGHGQSGPKNTAHRAGSGRAVGLVQRLPKTHKHYGVHMSHCNQGDYVGACCYGEDDECPALACDDAKPKDLLGIPWMLAFALRAGGWFLRSDIIWHKPNPMPESTQDRPTSAHEHVFLLSKRPTYFYDAVAIAEQAKDWSTGGPGVGIKETHHYGAANGGNGGLSKMAARYKGGDAPTTRNARNVWTITSKPFKESHFATMPPELAERCILAGTSERGACPHCGAPWERVVDRPKPPAVAPSEIDRFGTGNAGVHRKVGGQYQKWLDANPKKTIAWTPACACPEHDPIPCTVLDPFGGAGTTGLVADRLRRDAVMIDLNGAYRTMAAERVAGETPLFTDVL